MSKRCFDLVRTAGVSVGGACGAGFKILDRIDRIDRIDRMLASRREKQQKRDTGPRRVRQTNTIIPSSTAM
ncbi:MAG: hypothetical protein R6U13_00870, partial [Desulfatiglandaceae bacterium]